MKSYTGIAKLLIEKSNELNIDLNAKNKEGQTGFHISCYQGYDGHLEIVKMLIQKSDEIKLELNAKDKAGHTAFHLACKDGAIGLAYSR